MEVDVVTTGTFSPMCSSGAIINIGHSTPKIRISKAWINEVPVFCGLAAVDMYIGATEVAREDPLNKVFPGQFKYGGGHVIEDLVRGRDLILEAKSYGTDCYPRRELKTIINIKDMNNAFLLNPRNSYQNYNVAVNVHSKRPLYTYLGILRPNLANANFAGSGLLSPLINDPFYRTIGVGTRIFLGGGIGYVYFYGTQHDPNVPRTEHGIPRGGAGTLAVTGDLKGMSADFLRGVSMTGYGVSLAVGIGVPIPVLDEEMAAFTGISDEEIFAPVVDYSQDYPKAKGEPLGYVSYAQLRSGKIKLRGRTVECASISSLPKAREIALKLKDWIKNGKFELGKPTQPLPTEGSEITCSKLKYRPV